MTTAAPSLDETDEPTGDSSADAAEPTLRLQLDDDALSAGVFAPDTPACLFCGSPDLVPWSGRGKKPEYCEDHRTQKKRDAAERAAQRTPAKAKGKDAPGAGAASAWAGAGYLIQLRGPEPVGPAVGSVMQLQAASIAPHLDWLTKKLIVQFPWLASAGKGNELLTHLGPVIAPPLITGLIAAGVIPMSVAAPVLTVILRPLIADAMEQAANMAENMAAMSAAEAAVLAQTQAFIAEMFGQTETEENPA